MNAAMPAMDTVAHPGRYGEAEICSGGAPIVLSTRQARPSSAAVVFLPGTMVHPLSYGDLLDGVASDGFLAHNILDPVDTLRCGDASPERRTSSRPSRQVRS